MAVAVAVDVGGDGAVWLWLWPWLASQKRFFNHPQKRFLNQRLGCVGRTKKKKIATKKNRGAIFFVAVPRAVGRKFVFSRFHLIDAPIGRIDQMRWCHLIDAPIGRIDQMVRRPAAKKKRSKNI